jgi:predicted transcriptional regulator
METKTEQMKGVVMNEDYRQYLENLDKILSSMRNNENYVSISTILAANNLKYSDADKHYQIADKLVSDGYARVERDTAGIYVQITSSGIDFISKGGYINQLKKEEEKEKEDAELKASTIKANKTNIKFFKWNVGFAIFNLVMIIINFIIGYFNLIKPGH